MSSIKKYLWLIILAIGAVLISVKIFFGEQIFPKSKGEMLARVHCAACHQFPDPSLLDKTTWDKSVLPHMAFRMGFKNNNILYGYNRQDLKTIMETLPDQPMISAEELELIRQYYIGEAPEALEENPAKISQQIKQFSAHPVKSFNKHFITMLKFDSASQNFYIGNAKSFLYIVNSKFAVTDSIHFNSPPTHLIREGNQTYLSLVGRLFPSDQATGEIATIHPDHQLEYLIDSLKRAVFFEHTDFNEDQQADFIVCSFGNFKGDLALFLGQNDHTFKKHIISQSPGARKAIVIDWNRDGKKDILAQFAQGDERISVFLGDGNLKFTEKVLIRFPPVYGSSNFTLIDFNRDGFLDLVTTNGDNGDVSNIPKSYHGIRIFENDQHNNLKEVWSFPMNGAWQANPVDFDQDGDLDIAAISFFPDNKNHPERNFIYFENTGDYNFTPQLEPLSINGVWMAMETDDFDRDGDTDIILGSCRFEEDASRNEVLGSNQIRLLVLQNNLK